MNRATSFLVLAGLLVLAVIGVRYGIALAQAGGPYDLSWSTIDGGGHTGSPFGTAVGTARRCQTSGVRPLGRLG